MNEKRSKNIPNGTIEVKCDGACPDNPGGAMGCGIVIDDKSKKERIKKVQHPHPDNTSPSAEYWAVVEALLMLLNTNRNHLIIVLKTDLLWLVNQMKGENKAKSVAKYYPYYLKAKELAGDFTNLSFIWIPREENQEADQLATKALKEAGYRYRKD